MDKYGFVYIWYDRKRKMYYIGSHWGTEDDGYICSSNRMRNAYNRRPEDFKRRILTKVFTTRADLLDKEQQWFDLVKRYDAYYNLNFVVKNPWWADDDRKMTVGQKISKANTGRKPTDAQRENLRKSRIGKKHKPETIQKMRNSQKKSQDTKDKLSKAQRKVHRFRDPNGVEHTINNLKQFCKEHGLDYCNMTYLGKGTYYKETYRGWSSIK